MLSHLKKHCWKLGSKCDIPLNIHPSKFSWKQASMQASRSPALWKDRNTESNSALEIAANSLRKSQPCKLGAKTEASLRQASKQASTHPRGRNCNNTKKQNEGKCWRKTSKAEIGAMHIDVCISCHFKQVSPHWKGRCTFTLYMGQCSFLLTILAFRCPFSVHKLTLGAGEKGVSKTIRYKLRSGWFGLSQRERLPVVTFMLKLLGRKSECKTFAGSSEILRWLPHFQVQT